MQRRRDEQHRSGGAGGRPQGRAQIASRLAAVVDAKLAFEIQVHRVLPTDSIALMAGTWTARGTDAAGGVVQRAGTVRSVARRGADGAWRVLIEDLDLTGGPAATQ